MNTPTDDQLRQWLLQRLPESDAAALEDALLLDDALADRLEAAEADLLDDYARGRLDTDERAAMTAFRLTTPAARERLRFAQALAAVEARGAQQRPRRRAFAFAAGFAAAAALVLAVLWPRGETATYTLAARQLRDPAPAVLTLPSHATGIRLELEVEAELTGERYAVDIVGTLGPVYRGAAEPVRTTAGRRHVDVHVSASALAAGRYRVRLREPHGGAPVYEWSIETRQ